MFACVLLGVCDGSEPFEPLKGRFFGGKQLKKESIDTSPGMILDAPEGTAWAAWLASGSVWC